MAFRAAAYVVGALVGLLIVWMLSQPTEPERKFERIPITDVHTGPSPAGVIQKTGAPR